MSWVWVVLGALLIALVASVLFGFFFWRPRAQKRVTQATQMLAEELHGRPPLLIAPAQCRSADFRDASSLPGLGVLALTEQAVLYSSGERVVIMARDGLGRAADAAEAYAWADLAAERGYREFLVLRERIWEGLDETQRGRALALGTQLYAEYGDAVAKPRLERLLRIGLAQKTGTRSGSQT